jgi:hypothetical protein
MDRHEGSLSSDILEAKVEAIAADDLGGFHPAVSQHLTAAGTLGLIVLEAAFTGFRIVVILR